MLRKAVSSHALHTQNERTCLKVAKAFIPTQKAKQQQPPASSDSTNDQHECVRLKPPQELQGWASPMAKEKADLSLKKKINFFFKIPADLKQIPNRTFVSL